MNIKQHIPNSLTLGNLLCGCIGIVFVLKGEYQIGFAAMIVAAIFDFFDGFVARVLKVSGDLGMQLDSLADSVTFGVLPAMFMYKGLMSQTDNFYIPFIAFFISLMSTYRLAKFNLDTEQTENFKGLPTPLNAIFIASLFSSPLCMEILDLNSYILVIIITSLLLISNFPLLALKFKSTGWKENQAKYLLVIFSLILISTFKMNAIPLILPLYILLSVLHFKFKII